MKQNIKSPFRIKNGKRFQNILIKAAQGDKNISKMFIDNLNKSIQVYVENGYFKKALFEAFNWNTTNEGYNFWSDVFDNMENIDVKQSG